MAAQRLALSTEAQQQKRRRPASASFVLDGCVQTPRTETDSHNQQRRTSGRTAVKQSIGRFTAIEEFMFSTVSDFAQCLHLFGGDAQPRVVFLTFTIT